MCLGLFKDMLVLATSLLHWHCRRIDCCAKIIQASACQSMQYVLDTFHMMYWYNCRSGWSQQLNSGLPCRLEELDLKFEWPLLSQKLPARSYLLGPGQSMRILRQMNIEYFNSQHIYEIGRAIFMQHLCTVYTVKHFIESLISECKITKQA